MCVFAFPESWSAYSDKFTFFWPLSVFLEQWYSNRDPRAGCSYRNIIKLARISTLKRAVWLKTFVLFHYQQVFASRITLNIIPIHNLIFLTKRKVRLSLSSTLKRQTELISQLHAPVAFTHGKELRCILNRRLGVPQSQSGPCGEEKYLLPLPGFELRTLQPVAWSPYRLYRLCWKVFVVVKLQAFDRRYRLKTRLYIYIYIYIYIYNI